MSRDLQHLFHPGNADGYAAAMTEALQHLTRHLTSVDAPTTGRSPAEAAAPIGAVDLDRPLGGTSAAIEELTRLWLDDAVWFHEPGYAAHLNCPIVIPALVAELYLSAVNTSVDTFDQSVGATFMERHLIDWTARRVGFDAEADGVFTSGGTQSNLQALYLATARARRTAVPGQRLRIFASRDGHFSVQKAARVMGLGDDAVVPIEVDERRRMDPAALQQALVHAVGRGDRLVAVVATAGTTDFGAIDPLGPIAELCRTYDTWMHVDAAYGGGLLASPRRAHLLAGIERADSVTVDYHKTFFQPVSCSAVIVRDRALLAPATWHADYLNPVESANPNQVDKSLQTTRRFDALKLWLTLRVMGPDLIGDYVDRVIDLTEEVHDALTLRPEVELAAGSQLSTVVFRYAPAGATEEELSDLNASIRARLYREGSAMVAATRVDGRSFLKLTLLNPIATRADILGIIDQVCQVGSTVHTRTDLAEVAW